MIATYRLQLHPDFDFDDARQLVPYFAELGISHLYLSPINEARSGSTHGYDVVDHNAIREELGGEAGFEKLRKAAVEEGLGLVLDFVPNHAGVGPQNNTWQEFLTYGPHAESAGYFDVDWLPLKPELENKVLLPFLGNSYGEVLDEGEIDLTYELGLFFASYYENRFALNPATYPPILRELANKVKDDALTTELNGIADAFSSISRSNRTVCERLRAQLAEVLGPTDIAQRVSGLLDTEALHQLLEVQYWRLAFWKTAGSEINYRRFFTINELVALRMEDPSVFERTHELLRDLLTRDGVHGIRIDHIDGLYDPHEYLDRLSDLGAENIWVEKILAPGETMPKEWPVQGATGYSFMNDVMGILLNSDAENKLSRAYRRFINASPTFEDEAIRAKLEIMQQSLTSERSRLAYELDRLSEQDYHYRDFTLESLQTALTHIIACFDRYRTYLPYGDDDTEAIIGKLVHRAQQLPGARGAGVYEFIGDVITGNTNSKLERARRMWIGRLQQYTAPVAAKGVEDTAFYRYYRLAALNEVGGEPEHFGTSEHAFHSRCQFRATRYPHHLLATSTHDHKRGEDTRMRLITLAEDTDGWQDAVTRLEEIAEDYVTDVGPNRKDLYLLFQMIIALWIDPEGESLTKRLKDYIQKAAREAKLDTSWAKPNEAYEDTLAEVVEGLLQDERLEELKPFAEWVAGIGFCNTLSQVLLKITTPGVPDFYQGSELMDFSLVDPDNRRPVDYEQRMEMLDDLQPLLDEPSTEQLTAWLTRRDPQLKLYLVAQLLRLRDKTGELFTHGSHQKIDVSGEGADSWLVFTRATDNTQALVIVSRFHGLGEHEDPATVELPASRNGWRDVLSSASIQPEETAIKLHRLDFPWAVFISPAS